MATATANPPFSIHAGPTLEELAEQYGRMPVRRFRFDRYPGTEQDIIEIDAHEDRFCELVDGMLIEKAADFCAAFVATNLAFLMMEFEEPRDLGVVLGGGGMMRLAPGLVRIPSASFTSWEQFPKRKVTHEPIPAIHPDIAVEVLSESNTPKEMARKRRDYFGAGTRLVWIVDYHVRTVSVFTPANSDAPQVVEESGRVSGDPVLPGFSFAVAKLFEKLARE